MRNKTTERNNHMETFFSGHGMCLPGRGRAHCNLPPADRGSALFWLIGQKIGPNIIDDKNHTQTWPVMAVVCGNDFKYFWGNEYRVFFLSLAAAYCGVCSPRSRSLGLCVCKRRVWSPRGAQLMPRLCAYTPCSIITVAARGSKQ
jgi:hypothetical protein